MLWEEEAEARLRQQEQAKAKARDDSKKEMMLANEQQKILKEAKMAEETAEEEMLKVRACARVCGRVWLACVHVGTMGGGALARAYLRLVYASGRNQPNLITVPTVPHVPNVSISCRTV